MTWHYTARFILVTCCWNTQTPRRTTGINNRSRHVINIPNTTKLVLPKWTGAALIPDATPCSVSTGRQVRARYMVHGNHYYHTPTCRSHSLDFVVTATTGDDDSFLISRGRLWGGDREKIFNTEGRGGRTEWPEITRPTWSTAGGIKRILVKRHTTQSWNEYAVLEKSKWEVEAEGILVAIGWRQGEYASEMK